MDMEHYGDVRIVRPMAFSVHTGWNLGELGPEETATYLHSAPGQTKVLVGVKR